MERERADKRCGNGVPKNVNGTGPSGVSSASTDAIVYDIILSQGVFTSPSGWEHPDCKPSAKEIALEIGSGVVGSSLAAASSSPSE
jgi:hypothetical protein